jgi:serine/threonine protein phosphatase PrpC
MDGESIVFLYGVFRGRAFPEFCEFGSGLMGNGDDRTSRRFVKDNGNDVEDEFSKFLRGTHNEDLKKPTSAAPSSRALSQGSRPAPLRAVLFSNRLGERDSALIKELERNGVSTFDVPATVFTPGADHAGWSHRSNWFLSWGFLSAKSGQHSEDSEPFLGVLENESAARLVAGVCDGMGGAGAATAFGSENSFTEAYRASRVTRREVLMHCLPFMSEALMFGKSSFRSSGLGAALAQRMREVAGGLSSGTSRIRGTLTKSFPTTLACAEIRLQGVGPGLRSDVRAVWAGDSRVWVLTPASGLQQITLDDVSISDALEQLRQDPPLNNVVSASVDFELHEHSVSLNGPCVVICATDGVCGYVRSPGEVELLVLRAVERSARNGEPLEKILHDVFKSVAKDDASASIVAVGFVDVPALRMAFEGRLHELEERYAELDREMDAAERSAVTETVWQQEAALYSARMPSGGGGAHG